MKLKNFSLQGTNNLNFELNNFLGKKLVIYFIQKIQLQDVPMRGLIFQPSCQSLKPKIAKCLESREIA